MKANKIPAREELRREDTWALEDLYESDAAWKEAYDKAKEYIPAVSAFAGRLKTDAGSLLEYLKLEDAISGDLRRLHSYASMKYDQDTTNSVYQDLSNQCMRLWVELDSADAYSTPEIMEIDDTTLSDFYVQEPELIGYQRLLERLRRRKEHYLSAAEETILAAAGEMAQSPDTIGAIFRNADLHFPDVEDADGVRHPLTQGSATTLMESQDPQFRKKVFDTLYGTIRTYANTFAAILEAQVKQLQFFARMRKYNSALEAAVDENEVPAAVYRNLIQAVNANLTPLHRYMELRKRIMGVEKLHMYDIYTSIVPEATAEFPIEEAKKIVLEGLQPLGKEYCRVLKEGFDNRWIDVYENVGKCSGAYCNGAEPHPYVLLNHKDTLDSLFTLAHEMGHAMHSYLSNTTQPQCYKNYVIFVAEVASTCNEVLLMYHLLGKTTDPMQRAYLINHFLDQFRSTFYRQAQLAEFEMVINDQSAEGVSLTADTLNAIYFELNQRYYGEAMEPDSGIAVEWARIPHFFYNFYMYQYSTGFAAAVTLARTILEEGQPAVERYLKFLSSGCSQDPITLLREAGVDMMSAEPVEKALQLFDELIDEMESLMQ